MDSPSNNQLWAINTSSDFPLYLAYRTSGQSLDLILPAISVFLPALCGVFLNSFVIYVTFRASNLRSGTANFLMALICLFEVLHQSGHTVFLVVVISGTNFISLFQAELYTSPMVFGANACMMAMFCASADRLFAIVASLWHKKVSTEYKFVYLFGHTLLCILFGLYSLSYVLSNGVQNARRPTTGCICEILSDDAVRDHYFVGTTLLNLACIVCYVLIWVLIRYKKGVTKETNTRLLRSLVVILCVSVGGYLINLSIFQLAFSFQSLLGTYVRIWQFTFIAAVLLNISVAANAPILYLNSTEYRKAFKKEMSALRKKCPFKIQIQLTAQSTVHVLPNSQQNTPPVTRTYPTQSIAINRYTEM